MFNAEIAFATMLTFSCLTAIYVGLRSGKEYALGAGMSASLLAGTWFQVDVWGTSINVTMATAAILLVVYTCHSWRQIFRNIHALDCVIVTLTLWCVVVDVYHGGHALGVSVYAYGLWMLPYVAGRYSFLHAGALAKLTPFFAVAAIIISLASVVESLTNVNLWEWLFCEADDKVTRVKGLRFGLFHRAIGPTRNPIFLGIVLLSMIPFALEWTTRTRYVKWTSMLAFVALPLIVVGVLSTVSRGPVFCLILLSGFAYSVINRVARWSFVGATVVLMLVFALYPDQSLQLLEADGSKLTPGTIIQLDDADDPEIYTGTRQRLLVPRIYGPIVVAGGVFGYGTVDSSGFPPRNVPGLPSDPQTREKVRNVDNAYINVGLAFGIPGVVLFVMVWAAAIVQSLLLAQVISTYFYPTKTIVAAVFAGVVFAIGCEVFTVHWSYDFGFWTVFVFGAIAGLNSHYKGVRRANSLARASSYRQ